MAIGNTRAQRRDHAVRRQLRQAGATPGGRQVDDQALGIVQAKYVLGDRCRQRQCQQCALAVGLKGNALQPCTGWVGRVARRGDGIGGDAEGRRQP